MNGCYRDMWDSLRARLEADRAKNPLTSYLPSQILETMSELELAYTREEMDRMLAHFEATEGVKP